jgi:hypothetical protein
MKGVTQPLYSGTIPNKIHPTGFTNVTRISGHYTHKLDADPATGRKSLVFDFPVDELIFGGVIRREDKATPQE